MSRFDVFRILGEPGKVASYDGFERWEYPDLRGGRVNFDDTGAVVGWRLPPGAAPACCHVRSLSARAVTATELLTPILWVGIIQLAAWEAGERLLSRITRPPGPSVNAPLRATLAALLGLVAFANAVLLLAILHLLYAPLVVAAVLALAALGARRLSRLRPWRGLRPSLRDLPLAIAVAFVLAHLPNALYPVLDHDDNVYHLELPKHYLASHALDAPVFSLYGAMPHLIEILYVVPLALGDFVAGKVFALSIHFWILAGIGAFALPRIGRLGVGVGALLCLSGQNVEWHLGRAYNEPILGFFLLGAALAFLAWWETRRGVYLAIVGIACGAACASKYTAWLFAAVILASAAAGILRLEQSAPRRLRAALLLLLPCAALVLPWVVKNLITTGNPVYPNLYGIFGGADWSEIQVLHHWKSLRANGGLHKDLATYLMIPLRLVTDNERFLAATFSGSLMAVFLAGLLHPAAWRRAGAHVQMMAIGGGLAWAFTIQGGRYLVALVPLITLAAMFLLEGGRTLVAVAALAIGIAVTQRTLQPVTEFPAMDVFSVSRQELLEQNGGWKLCQFLNRRLPPDAKVLGLWYNRFFFLERPFEADAAYEAPSGLAWLRKLDDPETFARALAARGFTHLVVGTHPRDVYLNNKMGFDLLDDRVYPAEQLERDRMLWSEFSTRYLERMPWNGPGIVYRLRPL